MECRLSIDPVSIEYPSRVSMKSIDWHLTTDTFSTIMQPCKSWLILAKEAFVRFALTKKSLGQLAPQLSDSITCKSILVNRKHGKLVTSEIKIGSHWWTHHWSVATSSSVFITLHYSLYILDEISGRKEQYEKQNWTSCLGGFCDDIPQFSIFNHILPHWSFFQIFSDVACHRRILDARVKCPNASCSWVGELRDVQVSCVLYWISCYTRRRLSSWDLLKAPP